MVIDFKKHLATVERVKTTEDYEVRFTDTRDRKVLVMVESSYGPEAVTESDEEWDVAYLEIDGRTMQEGFLSSKERNEIIEFVKEQMKG